MKRLLLLNGPNINMLGQREPNVYGNDTLENIQDNVRQLVESNKGQLDTFQSNHEGELIDKIQQSEGNYQGIIFNPAAFTHTSVALRDAISSITVPVIEVHISNVHQREAFRHTSMLAPVCYGQIVGLGSKGYQLAAMAFLQENE